MAFAQADTLKSRTYLGLILAQFLAAFNDQAIHAAAMFFAINKKSMSEAQAISLMPILFYAPWALFCTLAGYLADRYSKRDSLVFWKFAEIAITLVALLGFWLGSGPIQSPWGPYLVLSTVFLMGTHSAFFVPAKYGAMPEILRPNLLSRGNGILESTSFLAVILGTVSGGVLTSVFFGREYIIGLILVVLAVLGSVASLLIQRMPAANPGRPFPTDLFKPLFQNLRSMLRSRPLALAILGIAFFTFLVAFMRGTVYMHGETRMPRWSEFKTSLVVGSVALGVSVGGLMAGFLSGGKVELGLVPVGAVGMIAASLLATVTLGWLPGLVVCIILIGFFTGFYTLPLFTLLQHRAPKASKGDSIATSNFINVTGAIAASLLFFVVVQAAHITKLAPIVEQQDNFARGELKHVLADSHGRPRYVEIEEPLSPEEPRLKKSIKIGPLTEIASESAKDDDEDEEMVPISLDADLIELVGGGLHEADGSPGSEVIVSTYLLRGVVHYKVRAADQALKPVYDNEKLPRFLFLGTALMTLGVLILLVWQLPDFFLRSALWLRSLGRYRLKVIGMNNLPGEGAMLLATNCDNVEMCLQVLSATDRFTRFVYLSAPTHAKAGLLLRYLARRTSLAVLHVGENETSAVEKGERLLRRGNLLGLPASGSVPALETLFYQLQERVPAPILPVYCCSTPSATGSPRVRVVLGVPLPPGTPWTMVQHEIRQLADWNDHAEEHGEEATTARIPGVSAASPTVPAADRPPHP